MRTVQFNPSAKLFGKKNGLKTGKALKMGLSWVMLSIASHSFAQESMSFAIETDPSTFALSGYSLHGRVSHAALPNLRVGVGVYSMAFPQVFVDINRNNQSQDWQVNLDLGLGFFSDYYFKPDRSGWYVGNQIASQQFTVKLDELAQTFSNVLIMPYGGYRWNLYQGLYVQGWGGAGYTTTVSGATDFADLNYDVAPIIPFGALHLGYEF